MVRVVSVAADARNMHMLHPDGNFFKIESTKLKEEERSLLLTSLLFQNLFKEIKTSSMSWGTFLHPVTLSMAFLLSIDIWVGV
jgi:hypothetical protein